jgi:hypothetical protein
VSTEATSEVAENFRARPALTVMAYRSCKSWSTWTTMVAS